MLVALILAACGSAPATDTAEPDVQQEGHDVPDKCPQESVVLDIFGPDAPVVGDSWTIWLRCDGATLLGPTVLQFDPADIASTNDNVATFEKAGDATMHMQVGGYYADTSLTVAEPDGAGPPPTGARSSARGGPRRCRPRCR